MPSNGDGTPSGALLCPTSATAAFVDSQVHKFEPTVIGNLSAPDLAVPFLKH